MRKVLNPEYDEVAAALYNEGPHYVYCNACGFETKRDSQHDPCPYHQRVLSDGTFLYDEFNQDGGPL